MITFAFGAVVGLATGHYWLCAVCVLAGAYGLCWILSTARYGPRWFRVWRLFFPIKDWD
jgi:hypothetical protein